MRTELTDDVGLVHDLSPRCDEMGDNAGWGRFVDAWRNGMSGEVSKEESRKNWGRPVVDGWEVA